MPKKKQPVETPETPSNPRSVNKADTELGHRIRLRRVEVGISQDDLGKALGVSFQQVQKYEKGVNRIAARRLEQLAAVLDVPVTFFYGNGTNGGGHSGKNQREVESLLAMDASFSLRLLRAYTSVKDTRVQRQFVTLLETVAEITKD